MKKFLKNPHGMALLTILLLTVLMVMMAVSMVFISTNFLALFGSAESKAVALKAAEAGVEYAIYQLNNDPEWGTASLAFVANPNTLPTFNRNNGLSSVITLEDGSKFTINFDESDPRFGSVNNLFGTTTIAGSETPPYTAKIVSIGESENGNATKVIVAYLVRGDFYPYTINSEGRIVLEAGEYTIGGEEAGNDTPPGYIYSSWTSTPAPGNLSIEGKPNAGTITSNAGMFIGNGPIDIAGTFDGTKQPSYPQNMYFGKIDVAKILDRAKTNSYGTLTTISPGTVKIKEEAPPAPPGDEAGYYPGGEVIKLEPGVTGFSEASGVITLDTAQHTIVLQQDIFIDGSRANIDGSDRFEDLATMLGSSPSDRLFRIYRTDAMQMEETVDTEVVYHPPPPPPPNTPAGPGWFETILIPQDNEGRYARLDLNGHNIYSNSHLMLGLEVVGTGRIVSYGKIALLLGVNQGLDKNGNEKKITLISGDDLIIELSDSTKSSINKGFFYALDDIYIAPTNPTNSLLVAGADTDNTDRVSIYLSPGEILTSSSGSPNRTGIGHYNPPDPDDEHAHSGDKWWRKDYEGEGAIVRTVEDLDPDAPVDYIIVEADDEWDHDADLEFCLEYDGYKQINLGKLRIKITTTATPEVTIIDPDDPTQAPQALPGSLTQTQLNAFGAQILSEFGNAIPTFEITMKATVTSSNKYKNVNHEAEENESKFDTSSTDGKFVLTPNISYMQDIMNIERDTFTVRKAACYEME